MRFGFVDEHRDVWPIAVMCRVLGVSVSGYYAWRSRPESARGRANRALLDVVRVVHAESGGTYGAPRVHAALQALGRRVGRHRVARLMRRAGLRGLAALPRRMRTTDSRHDHPIAPNRLGRSFEAARPNQVWLGDLTYVRTGKGWLFLAAVLDLHTRKIVGWSMRETLHAEIALEALEMAVRRQRPAPSLICHTDRGVQGGLDRSSRRGHLGWRGDGASGASAGVLHPSVLRGRPLGAAATASGSSGPCRLRSAPLGKSWRKSPLVFSVVPRCQGLWGSQKQTGRPARAFGSACRAILAPWSQARDRRSCSGPGRDRGGDGVSDGLGAATGGRWSVPHPRPLAATGHRREMGQPGEARRAPDRRGLRPGGAGRRSGPPPRAPARRGRPPRRGRSPIMIPGATKDVPRTGRERGRAHGDPSAPVASAGRRSARAASRAAALDVQGPGRMASGLMRRVASSGTSIGPPRARSARGSRREPIARADAARAGGPSRRRADPRSPFRPVARSGGEAILHVATQRFVPHRLSTPRAAAQSDRRAMARPWRGARGRPWRVAALRRSARGIVEGARPTHRALSRTPRPWARSRAISSRSSNDKVASRHRFGRDGQMRGRHAPGPPEPPGSNRRRETRLLRRAFARATRRDRGPRAGPGPPAAPPAAAQASAARPAMPDPSAVPSPPSQPPPPGRRDDRSRPPWTRASRTERRSPPRGSRPR